MVRNAKGFSFIEVMVACVILGVGLWGTMNVVSFANRAEIKKVKSTQKDAIVYNMLQDLRKRPELLQKNFSGSTPTTLLATPSNFPMAWDWDQNIQPVAACPTCRGRLGYVVQPVAGYHDFMLATLKICSDHAISTSCEVYQMYMVTK